MVNNSLRLFGAHRAAGQHRAQQVGQRHVGGAFNLTRGCHCCHCGSGIAARPLLCQPHCSLFPAGRWQAPGPTPPAGLCGPGRHPPLGNEPGRRRPRFAPMHAGFRAPLRRQPPHPLVHPIVKTQQVARHPPVQQRPVDVSVGPDTPAATPCRETPQKWPGAVASCSSDNARKSSAGSDSAIRIVIPALLDCWRLECHHQDNNPSVLLLHIAKA